jgi:hypothetical protein
MQRADGEIGEIEVLEGCEFGLDKVGINEFVGIHKHRSELAAAIGRQLPGILGVDH